MFCPNCGAENKDTSAPCVRCGFKLSGVSASKFKGTIMLNSDETVQELIEAQRRKLQEAKPAEPAAPASGPLAAVEAAPPTGPDANGGVPRPRRKLGGATILGVAPQMGGFKGMPEAATLESPQHPTPLPSPAAPARAPSAPPTDPNAPTEAMQAFAPGADLSTTAIGGTAPQPVMPEPLPAAARGTQPLQQPAAAPGNAAFQTQASPRAALDTPSPGKTVPLQQVPDPANTTAPLPPQAQGALEAGGASLPPISSLPSINKGISAGELFLVIATCGVYGIVRLLRRKEP